MRSPASNAARGVVLMIGLLVAVRLAGMGLLPLMDATEARYAEIGRKMAALGDWVTPWYDDGVPFWGKPPLSFWLTAASFRLFGVNEFTARLPHFLCGALTALLAWRLAARRAPQEALCTVALLGASTLFFVSSGAVMTDAALVLGTTLAMYGFWVGLHGSSKAPPRERWWLFVGAAVGLLAKGPVALVLIGLPLLAWTLACGRAPAAWRAFPWIAGVISIAVLVVPWYVLAELRTPGFIGYFLVGEHWHRFVTPGWRGDLYGSTHRFAPGTVWLFAVAGFLPWSVLLPAAALYRRWMQPAASRESHDRSWRLYLLLWGLTPLLFFTAARNIIWTYVLPGAPAFALLGAHWLARCPVDLRQRLVWAGLALSLVGAVGVAVQVERSGQAEARSAKSLVAACTAQRVGNEPLIYFGTRPYSAAFYSAGQARRVDSVGQLAASVPAGGACVAIESDRLAQLRLVPAMRIDAIGRFGSHELVRMMPTAATKATQAPAASESMAPVHGAAR